MIFKNSSLIWTVALTSALALGVACSSTNKKDTETQTEEAAQTATSGEVQRHVETQQPGEQSVTVTPSPTPSMNQATTQTPETYEEEAQDETSVAPNEQSAGTVGDEEIVESESESIVVTEE